MLDISKSPLALKDAQNIWLYSFENWGEQQAYQYLFGLDETIKKLAQDPKLGVDIGFLRQGYRRYPYKSHLIVYRYSSKNLEIMRILHQRMDIIRHKLQ